MPPNDTLRINNKGVDQHSYDAIVIGSGISGGWAAKELSEKGLRVLVLDRGRNVEHVKDYTDTNKNPWELTHRGGKTVADKKENPIQSRIYAYNEVSKHFFVDDAQHPYTQVKPWTWIRGYQVGGRSLVWGRLCFRWGELDFEANARDGIGTDWPIRYKDLKPWYDYVEPFVGVSGTREGIDHLPDGLFLPPMEMNCMEKDIAARLKTLYNDERRMFIARVANLTRSVGGRGPCQYRNKCETGCPFGGYFSSNSATLPAAMRTGNCTIRPWSIVTEILYDKNKQRATGVRVIDSETKEVTEFFSKVIFVNASTINTAFLLLNSVSDIFPDGFGNSSGQVGRNLMDHHLGAGASGRLEGMEDRYYYGRRPTVNYIPRFRNLPGQPGHPDFLRGYAYQSGAWRGGWGSHESDAVGVGAQFKEALTEPGAWGFDLAGFGETMPYADNRVTLDHDRKDAWGLPLVAIDCTLHDNERNMRKDMLASAQEMLQRLGAKDITVHDSTDKENQRVFSVHDMGIARMGRDPKTSVLNQHNQLHDVKNVFITDGSCMASTACQNPSLTYMALTARACDFAVNELKRNNL